MRAYSIDVENQELKEIDIEMQANTVYTFFNSILTDEFSILDKHLIHGDSNAISQNKKPFFIAEQLIVGDAFIIGKNGFEDVDATIPKDDLESLINYEVTPFYIDALELLKDSDINLYKIFEVAKKDENIQLNTEWVLHIFNMADDKTKEYFLDELKIAIETKKEILEHMQYMAVLALNATNSQ